MNCLSPTPYCINGLAVEMMPQDTDGDNVNDWAMVELWASDFDNGSYHHKGANEGYCSLILFRVISTIQDSSGDNKLE